VDSVRFVVTNFV